MLASGTQPLRVLILGGTAEATALAAACAGHPGLDPLTSLAGRTRTPRLPAGAVRIGGFGGSAGLRRFLHEEGIDRVVDATHPFAVAMARHAEIACRAAAVPRLRLLRPAWRRQAGDRWIEAADASGAARLLPGLGQRVFLTVGRFELAPFAAVDGIDYLVRSVEPAPEPMPLAGVWITARGPFELDHELDLLRRYRIQVLVTKASGGASTYAKIEAARHLSLPVVMLRRPPPPPGPVTEDVAGALAWLKGEASAAQGGSS